ncbi:hypothetical protein OIDMADRAFT_47376 [Oidiodendron maius Zn]|uniref:DUF6590 domain-containing protein n=1 Tax=Oidiodendron maius (strain Zn) TaxID=913774 RepID=A0A0C3HX13_OIDMZ|nr:hypothetical protein OIDMADRAFT_47376 [Oidiodendron maius Zn]
MSSRKKYPKPWSNWEWNDTYERNYRYRRGDYEYEYENVAEASNAVAIPGSSSHENYTYAPQSSVYGITSQLDQFNLGSSTRGPSVISTRDPYRSNEPLHPEYQVHHSKEFGIGRVLKILWTEPLGVTGTVLTKPAQKTKHGEKAYTSIRRFVITNTFEGHSLCLPVLTYSGNGLLKKGVKAADHCIIYTGKPESLKGEEILNSSIQMVPHNPRTKLDKMSRLNYAKVYTVEHNVKVCFIGEVTGKHLRRLLDDHQRITRVDSSYYDNTGSDSFTQVYDDSSLHGSYPSVPAAEPRTTAELYDIALTPLDEPYASSFQPEDSQQGYSANPEAGADDHSHQYDGSLYEE